MGLPVRRIGRFLFGSAAIGLISAIGTFRLQTITVSPLLTLVRQLEKWVFISFIFMFIMVLFRNLTLVFHFACDQLGFQEAPWPVRQSGWCEKSGCRIRFGGGRLKVV